MARTILFGFDPDTNEPLDSRLVVDTLAERDALNPQVIYEGMVVYVKETTFQYTLINLNPLDWDIYAGPTGPQGPQGDTGDTGNTGPSGPRGLQGDKGDQGEQGETGSQGEAGPTGNAGADGSIGGRGPMGATGLKGDDGAQGPMGNTGATGAKGDDGDSITGPKGDTGADGAKGDTGADGTVGPKGDTGDQGERGIDGQTGDPGPKGDTGEMGASGIGLMPFGTSFPIPDPDVDIEFRTFNLTATFEGNTPGIYLVKNGSYELIADTATGGGGSTDAWLEFTRGSSYQYQNADGSTTTGTDATDKDGNTDANYIEIKGPQDTIFYRIETNSVTDVAASAIIRSQNTGGTGKNDGIIVATNTY